MHWIILIFAGFFEIGWAIGLKYTEGFTRLWPTVGTVLAMVISLGLLVVWQSSIDRFLFTWADCCFQRPDRVF